VLRAQALAARQLEAATIAAKRAARAAKAQRALSEAALADSTSCELKVPEGVQLVATAASDDEDIASLFDDATGDAHPAADEGGGGGLGGVGGVGGGVDSHVTVPLGEALRRWKGKKPKELLADLVRARKWPTPAYRRWHVGTGLVAASVMVRDTEYAPSELPQVGDGRGPQLLSGVAVGTYVCATPAEAEQLAAVRAPRLQPIGTTRR
jgi:hypothetical protein